MLRNYLAAAIRNLFRNRAYAAINICGLALGFTAVILIGLFVRDELSYDRSGRATDRLYTMHRDHQRCAEHRPRRTCARTSPGDGARLPGSGSRNAPRLFRRNAATAGTQEVIVALRWADPNFFRLFPPQGDRGRRGCGTEDARMASS